MKGKLGSLHNGEGQIGGILDWEVTSLVNEFTQAGDLIHRAAKWRVTASSYWLFTTPSQVTIRLYSEGRGYWEGKGTVTSSPQKIFDTLIHDEIAIVGEGILEGRE